MKIKLIIFFLLIVVGCRIHAQLNKIEACKINEEIYSPSDTLVLEFNNIDSVEHRYFIVLKQNYKERWVPRVPEGQQTYLKQGKLNVNQRKNVKIFLNEVMIDHDYTPGDTIEFYLNITYTTPRIPMWEKDGFQTALESYFEVVIE